MTTNRKIKVGLVQHSFTADVESNRARNLTAIESLASEGAQLIVLSELHDSLYFCQTEDVENFALAEEIPSDFTEFYANAAMTNNVVLVTSVFERRAPGLYHNTALVFDTNGEMAGKYSTRNSTSHPVTSVSNRYRLHWDVWAYWFAGTSGIPRPRA